MANVTIADLPSASTATLADQFEVNQGGVSKKVTGQLIADLVEGQLGTIATQDSTNVTITGGSVTGITDLAIADGGTGASTAQGARNNILPSQTGNANKFLKTDGTNVTWADTGLVNGDRGDITVSNNGNTWTIDNNAITTSKIADSNVTDSKLTNSGVTAGTYGSVGDIPIVTVNNKGRVTSVSTEPLVISGTLIGYQVFTTSGTYNKGTNNPGFVIVEVVGGGGSGGGTSFTRVNGGTSSFGAHCTATGGSAGGTANVGGSGGTGTGGDINVTGQSGANGGAGDNESGGLSKYGGNIGQGGYGASYTSGKTQISAGAGGAGGYAMKKIASGSLAAFETVTVGAGGNGSGSATYDGKDGIVIVWEYR